MSGTENGGPAATATAAFFAWGVLLAVFSAIVAPRLQHRFGSLKVLCASLPLLAADLVVLGHGGHTTAGIVAVRRRALTLRAEEQAPRHATEDGGTAFAR